MAISDVDIANLALTKLGAQPIVSFGDVNKRAAAFNRSYAMLRDKLQRVWRWNFTRKYANLPAATVPPLFEYTNAYQLPDDCLRLEIASVGGPSDFGIGMAGMNLNDFGFDRQQDYRIVGRMIYTWVTPPLKIVYAARVTDPNQFDVAFNESFAFYLAWQLCEELTGSAQKKKDAMQEYQFSIREARMTNAIELPSEIIPDDTFMGSRIAN